MIRTHSIGIGVATILALVGCSDSNVPPPPPPAPIGVPGMPGMPGMPTGMVMPAMPPPPLMPGYQMVPGTAYSFQVPADWTRLTVPGPPEVIMRAPVPIDGSYHVNVNVVSEPFMGDGPAYAQANLAQIQVAAQVAGQRPAMVGALPGMDIDSIWAQQTPPTHTLQRFVARNGRGYVFTCAGPIPSWEAARPTCELILSTFRLVPVNAPKKGGSSKVVLWIIVIGFLSLICCGVTAAIAIPSFIGYTRRSKTAEVVTNLNQIYQGVATYAMQERIDPTIPGGGIAPPSLPPAAPRTPPVPTDMRQIGDFSHPSWAAIGFAPMDPLYYSYELQPGPDGRSFVIRALGDLDGDTQLSTFELHGTIDAQGTVSREPMLRITDELE